VLLFLAVILVRIWTLVKAKPLHAVGDSRASKLDDRSRSLLEKDEAMSIVAAIWLSRKVRAHPQDPAAKE
jgi:hypothetical protein